MWGSQSQPWNQWALQPSMFSNVPHDEIDWAQLAKQWIQMQQGQESAPQAQHAPTSGPPPSGQGGPPFGAEEYGGHEHSMPPQMRDTHHPLPEPYAPGANDMGKRPDMPIEPDPFAQPEPGGGYWQQDWDVRAAAIADIDERMWAPPPIPPAVPVDLPQPLMPNEKKTFDYGHVNDAPTLAMQTVDYNHASDHHPYGYGPPPMPHKKPYMPPPFPMYPAPPPEDPYDQYWSQVAATPMIPATFLRKEKPASTASSSRPAEEEMPHIDAAKRKQLPAWIREGLEKMEQERLKRLEKERAEKELLEKAKKSQSNDVLGLGGYNDSPSRPAKSKFDSDSEREEEGEETKEEEKKPARNNIQDEPIIKREINIPLLDCRTDEERQRDMMLKVRRMLTEILLDVTTEEMTSVAREVYQKALAKAPARPLASSTALRSLATAGLSSLASYESQSEASASEDEESSTSDEELYKRIQEKKKQFAVKERKILADLARMEEERKLKEEKRLKETATVRHETGPNATESEKPEVIENRNTQSESDGRTENQDQNHNENREENNDNEVSMCRPEGPEVPPGLTPPVYTAELPPQLEKHVEGSENAQPNDGQVNEGDDQLGNQKPGQSESESGDSSSESESNSRSSYSGSSDKSHRNSRKRHSDRSRRHSCSRKKNKSHRNSDSRRKHGRSKNSSRHGSSDSSRDREKGRRDRVRSKRKNKDRERDLSASSASSGRSEHRESKSSKHSRRDSRRSPDKRGRRSWSYDRRSKRERSRSRSRSSKNRSPDYRYSHNDSHHSSRNKSFEGDHKRSRRELRRSSRSRSHSRTPPRRYKRKSRSPSFERGRYYKSSKIGSYDR